jgi:hypothetical protein
MVRDSDEIKQLVALRYLLAGRPKFDMKLAIEVEKRMSLERSKGCYDRHFRPLQKPPPMPVRLRDEAETPAEQQMVKFLTDRHREHNRRCTRCGHGRVQETGNPYRGESAQAELRGAPNGDAAGPGEPE